MADTITLRSDLAMTQSELTMLDFDLTTTQPVITTLGSNLAQTDADLGVVEPDLADLQGDVSAMKWHASKVVLNPSGGPSSHAAAAVNKFEIVAAENRTSNSRGMSPIRWTADLRRRAFPHPDLAVPPRPGGPEGSWALAHVQRSMLTHPSFQTLPLSTARHEARLRLLDRIERGATAAGPPEEDMWLAWIHGLLAADLWMEQGGIEHLAACLVEAGGLYDELDLNPSASPWRLQLPRARAWVSAAPEREAVWSKLAHHADAAGVGRASVLPFLWPDRRGLAESVLARTGGPVHRVPYLVLSISDGPTLRQALHDAWGAPLINLLGLENPAPEAAWLCVLLGLVAQAGHAATEALLSRIGSAPYTPGLPAALARALALLDTPDALAGVAALLPHARRPAGAALEAAGERGVHALGTVADSVEGRAVLDALVRDAPTVAGDAVAQSGWTAEHVRRRVRYRDLARAPSDRLPPVLQHPPWLAGPPAGRPRRPGLEIPPWNESVRWQRGEREAWRERAIDWPERGRLPEHLSRWLGTALGVDLGRLAPQDLQRPDLLDGLRLLVSTSQGPIHLSSLMVLPPEAACLVWTLAPTERFHRLDELGAFIADHGLPALDGLLRYAERDTVDGLKLLRPFDTPRAAPLVARAWAERPSTRPAARRWLRDHPQAAAAGLIPLALDLPDVPGQQAADLLRQLAVWGHVDAVLDAARACGQIAAVREVLDTDPLRLFPVNRPTLPPFAAPVSLPPPELRSGGALPLDAMGHVLEMLSWSTLDQPYAGLREVRAACTPRSLDGFVWALYEAWLGDGAPAKEAWAFRALGLLGSDVIAERLDPLIRRWPLESQHARAVMGLDVLVCLGTDVALQRLEAIASKTKTKALQAQARERIEVVAARRGLSRDELSDRTTPDLGFDAQGALHLDFGPRQFVLRLDQALRPVVHDATGQILKDLPKPNSKDDPAASADAVERFKGVKQALKVLGPQVVERFERAMISGRTWPARELRTLLGPHPILGGLVRRLVWSVAGRSARWSEDQIWMDAEDRPLVVADEDAVLLAHPIDTEGTEAVGRLLAEYRLVQPFPQVGRAIQHLTPDEAASPTLDRLHRLTLPTTRLLGLEKRGWRKVAPQDAGIVPAMSWDAGGDLRVTLGFEPGILVDEPTAWDTQTLGELSITHAGEPACFGDLGPRRASELLVVLATLG